MPIWQIQEIAVLSAPAGDIFQRKIDEIFKNLPNVFDIADDIVFGGYDIDGKGHDERL